MALNRRKPRATRASCRFSIGSVERELAFEHSERVESQVRSSAEVGARDRELFGLARRQHGVVTRRQMLDLGIGRSTIARRIDHGELHEVFRGIYVLGVRRISRRGRWMAAVLAAGNGAHLSHRSAGQLWRILPSTSGPSEVTCPRGRVVRRSGIVAHTSTLAEDEREVVDGLPVTAAFRTIFDLAVILGTRELERAWHEALARGLTAAVSLPMFLERYPGHRGTRSLRQLICSAQPVGITRNDFEEAFLALVDKHGLPRPRMNGDLFLRGRFFQIDALWECERVAVELDSRSVHDTPRNFESDRQRDRILLAEGWRTMRVTWRQLQEEPEAIASDLCLALAAPTHQR